jgi:hypothetical protein
MGQDPTAKSTASNADPAEKPQPIDSDIQETARLAPDGVADTTSDVQSKTTDSAPRETARASDESSLSSVAAFLMEDCPTFIDSLSRAVEPDVAPAILRKLRRTAHSASSEAAAFERLAAVTIHDAKPDAAAKICAALAARTAGLAARRANRASGPIDAVELFTAWLETARAMIAARGREGLHRLLPTARLVARKSAERGDSAVEIAATMRRIAARILAELSLEHAFDLAAEQQERDLTERRTLSPRSNLKHSPVQMTLHPR